VDSVRPFVRHTSHASDGSPWRCLVRVPAEFEQEDRTRAYPVVYLLHGSIHTESDWQSPGKGRLASILEELEQTGVFKPMIVVMPDSKPEHLPLDRNFPDPLDFEKYFLHLMEEVEKIYSVDPCRRAISGLSMGGKQALEIGLSNPGEFCVIGSFSGALQRISIPDAVQKIKEVKKINRGFRLFYLRCGREDKWIQLRESNKKLTRQLSGIGFCDFAYPEGNHDWDCWNPILREFFTKLSGLWGEPEENDGSSQGWADHCLWSALVVRPGFLQLLKRAFARLRAGLG
jgi:enterochelin esterase-like enzyme